MEIRIKELKTLASMDLQSLLIKLSQYDEEFYLNFNEDFTGVSICNYPQELLRQIEQNEELALIN